MSIVINLLYVMTKIPWLLVMLWRSSLILVVCLAWYKLLNEMSKWLFSGVELDSWLDGKRHLRIEKSNELIKGLQERIDELSKLNVQLEKEKEMLEKKLTVQPSRRDQGTCVEDKHPTEGKQETTKLIEEFKDQKENNKMILNKLEHLESLYTLITNKDDLVKELELYNQAKSKVTNLESEIMMFKCKNTEMKEKLNQMKAEIKQYEKLTSELKQNLKEEKNKNEECCKKYEELKDENDNLQSQVCNLSADLENIKKDDDMRNKYEHTKSLLELTNEKLETLKIDYETVKKELSDRNEKYICDHRMLKQELELAEKSKQEISAQYEITKLELKSSNDYVTELKSHYEILLTQLSKSNETIDDLNSKLNQAKVDLEHSSNKLDLMNSNLSETQETLTQLKLNLNDEIHNSKLYKDENERLMNKISVMENNKRTWEKEINALRLTLKKYRENEEKEMSKHTELVCEMTRKIEEFKHERIQLNYDIRELKRKIEELTKEKEEMSRKFEETQEKVLKQNDRALQEIQNEMKVKLESANEKIVQKDDKLEQIEDLYKARERELRLKYSRRETELKRQLETLTLNNSEIILERARLANEKLRLQQEMRDKSGAVPLNVQILEQLKVQLEKRVDELEVSNVELEAKLASYGSGGKFSDHELTSGGEEGYPGSPRRSLCTPPPSPNRRGSSGSSPASPAQPCKLLSSLSSTKYLSLGRDIPSPDLGIDSDHGRVSNSETSDNPDKSSLAKLVEENSQLQRMLHKTRQALENTIKQLAAANRRKCQIERDICKQLHKTQHIIRKARVNIQSSESRERGEDAENIDPLAS